MEYKIVNQGKYTVFEINEARFDAKLAPDFRRTFEESAGAINSHLVLDLSQVSFMDSSGLGAIMGMYKMLAGKKISIVNSQRAVKELLKLTRMDKLISSYDTIEDAVTTVA